MKTETKELLIWMLRLAGVGQLFVAGIYPWVRRILEWDADLDRMKNVWNRQIAHTYSRYIQGLNAAFGCIALFLAPAFFEDNRVASALALLLAVYWAGRLVIALGFYDTRGVTDRRPLFRYGAWAFNGLFVYLAVTFGLVFWIGLN